MYRRVIEAVTALPWAILPEKLAAIQDLLALRATGGKVSAEQIRAVTEAASQGRVTMTANSSVAVIPVVGSLMPRGNLITESSGAVSVERLAGVFRAAMADPEIGGIVFDIDSPGGQVGGIDELASEIYQARGQKPIVAVANGLAASAAYWLASAADELVVTPSGEVGSIGVFAVHTDYSEALAKEGVNVTLISAGKYKVEGNPYQPLSEEALAAGQARVDEFYGMFTGAVARHRGASQADVMDGFGQGRLVSAEQALRLGMVDKVATIDQVVNDMIAGSNDLDRRRRRQRALSWHIPGSVEPVQ